MRETITQALNIIRTEFIDNQGRPRELQWTNLNGKAEMLLFIASEVLAADDELLVEITNVNNIILNNL
jgi:hypothetical protein